MDLITTHGYKSLTNWHASKVGHQISLKGRNSLKFQCGFPRRWWRSKFGISASKSWSFSGGILLRVWNLSPEKPTKNRLFGAEIWRPWRVYRYVFVLIAYYRHVFHASQAVQSFVHDRFAKKMITTAYYTSVCFMNLDDATKSLSSQDATNRYKRSV